MEEERAGEFTLAVVAVFASWLTTRLLRRNGGTLGLDVPNHRSLHEEEVTCKGGVGILVGVAAAVAVERLLFGGTVTATRELSIILLAAMGIAIVFVVDDLKGLPIHFRLGVQFTLAGAAVIATGLWQVPVLGLAASWITAALAVLGIVWMMNLYNFMDGMDGFAGGMTVSGFAVMSILSIQAGETALGLASLAVVGGTLGFLPHNWPKPKAKIFMGDGGSVTIGFLAAVFGLFGVLRGAFSLWVPLLAFSPFILDASYTLFKRTVQRKRIWLAHREHLYQRLVLSGWSHRRTLALEYGMMAAAAVASLMYDSLPSGIQSAILIGWALAFGGFVVFVTRRDEPGEEVRGSPERLVLSSAEEAAAKLAERSMESRRRRVSA